MSARVAVVIVVGWLGSAAVVGGVYWLVSARLETMMGQHEKRLEQIDNDLNKLHEQLTSKQQVPLDFVPPDKELVPNTIAVLPLAILPEVSSPEGQAATRAMAGVVSTELVNKLSAFADVKVVPLSRIPESSDLKPLPKGQAWFDPQQVGRKLGVTYILTGRFSGYALDSRNVYFELISVRTGFVVWSMSALVSNTVRDFRETAGTKAPFQSDVEKVAAEVSPKVRVLVTAKE